MEIVVEWELVERRKARLEVPDDAESAHITELAAKMAISGRAGKMDEILSRGTGHVQWNAPDGRFGGQA